MVDLTKMRTAGMADPDELLVLLDHSNIPWAKCDGHTLLALLVEGISGTRSTDLSGVLDIHVRLYGGWYSGSETSHARYEASSFYQEIWPAIFNYRNTYCRIHLKFADSLAASESIDGWSSQGIRIQHTVADRNSPPRLSTAKASCLREDCELPRLKKWLRKSTGCLASECPNTFRDCFSRLQQKQVDTHLVSDLLFYATNPFPFREIVVGSDDLDMIPALITARLIQKETTPLFHLRFLNPTMYLDAELSRLGVSILRLPDAASTCKEKR